jgi:hypothetical protein
LLFFEPGLAVRQVELAFYLCETVIPFVVFLISLDSQGFLHGEIRFPLCGKLFPLAGRMIWRVHPSRNETEGAGMPRKARDLVSQAEKIANAWAKFFPKKTFSGLTLEQFRETFKPLREVRAQLAELASQRKMLLFRRQRLDMAGRPVLQRVVHAVRGDPEVGEDDAMYGSMGYVTRHRRRKPGRKKKALGRRAARKEKDS